MRRRVRGRTTFAPQTLTCRVLGCRFRFAADDRVLHWCQRGCPAGGSKEYPSRAEAEQMAATLDQEPRGPAILLAGLGGTVHRERAQNPPP